MALEFKQEDSYCLKGVWAVVLRGLQCEWKDSINAV